MNNDNIHMPRMTWRHIARVGADIFSFLSPKFRSSPKKSNPSKIGVLLQWGIGDAVLALPLLHGLRDAYPNSIIDLIGKPWLLELFANENFMDRTKVLVPPWTKYFGKYRFWERDWWIFIQQIRQIRHERYDLLITARFDVRDNLQLKLLGARETAGFSKAGGAAWITIDLRLDIDSHNKLHRSEVAVEVLHAITGKRRSSLPQFNIHERLKNDAIEQLKALGYIAGPIVIMHGGAGHPIRRWSNARFSNALSQGLPKNAFVVIVTEETAHDGYDIRVPDWLQSSRWHGSLNELKGLLSVSNLLLCTDSGAMHIAVACNCPIVALFGPQRTEWFGPLGENSSVLKVEPMPCRPCFDACLYARPMCMDFISTFDVSATVSGALEKWEDKIYRSS